MTELPDTNGGNGSASDKKEDSGIQSLETAAAALASVGTAEGEGKEDPSPASGKRDHTGTSTTPGIMGGHSAKRGKREWLSFRGARHTRVGEEYQVASLPPVGGGTTAKSDETTEDNEKGN